MIYKTITFNYITIDVICYYFMFVVFMITCVLFLFYSLRMGTMERNNNEIYTNWNMFSSCNGMESIKET